MLPFTSLQNLHKPAIDMLCYFSWFYNQEALPTGLAGLIHTRVWQAELTAFSPRSHSIPSKNTVHILVRVELKYLEFRFEHSTDILVCEYILQMAKYHCRALRGLKAGLRGLP